MNSVGYWATCKLQRKGLGDLLNIGCLLTICFKNIFCISGVQCEKQVPQGIDAGVTCDLVPLPPLTLLGEQELDEVDSDVDDNDDPDWQWDSDGSSDFISPVTTPVK